MTPQVKSRNEMLALERIEREHNIISRGPSNSIGFPSLANICVEFTEMKEEVTLTKDHLPYSSAGFRSMAKAVLKKLARD